MPLYEYQCQECGEKTEVVRRFDDAPLAICSSCGGALKKLISAPAIQFKGSGFYLTDYGRSGSSAASKNESNANESKAGDSKSSESKASESKASESKSSESKSSESKSSSTSESSRSSSTTKTD